MSGAKQANKKAGRGITRSSAAEYLTFVSASGKGGVETIYADENVWLTQKMMGQLYDVEPQTINYHLKKVFADRELGEEAVIRNFRITAADGKSYDTNRFIAAADRQVLQDAGQITAEIARAHAESEFEKYRIVQDRLYQSDFDRRLLGNGEVDETPLIEVEKRMTRKKGGCDAS